jgi:methionine synthase II (cobalamin-independent)
MTSRHDHPAPTDPATVPALALAGAVTSIGSWPGTDPHEAARIVAGECPLLPALPELPGRGAGADMVGRTAALLPGITAEVVPSGWRLTQRPGPDERRALSWVRQDLDAFEEAVHATASPVKVQVVGPSTLAASLELRGGERAISDHGARADLTEALAEAAAEQVREARRRAASAAAVVVQIDEPWLPAVLNGRVRTASGYRTYRSVPAHEVRDGLRTVVGAISAAGGLAAIHTCASDAPFELLSGTGARVLSFELALVPVTAYDAIAAAIDGGTQVLLGVVPTDGRSMSDLRTNVDAVQRWWGHLGFAPDLLPQRCAMTPACGMASLSAASARAALARCHDIASAVLEDPDGDHRTRR